MNGRRESRGRLGIAGLTAAGFAIALATLVSSQLALMSVLDAGRAERAASQIASSRFTSDLIEQTVVQAVGPIAGEGLAQQAAGVASNDPNVRSVVETSLLNAHRQIVDRDAPVETPNGNTAVGSAIVESITDTASANGVDVGALGLGDPADIVGQAAVPEIVPTDLPRLGLRDVAETTRSIALIAMLAFAAMTLIAHPRTGRAIRGIGTKVAVVTGGWLVVLLVAGWLIGLIENTLFGEMIQVVWSDAVPSMMLLVGSGLIIGVALVFVGISVDGFSRERRRRDGEYPPLRY